MDLNANDSKRHIDADEKLEEMIEILGCIITDNDIEVSRDLYKAVLEHEDRISPLQRAKLETYMALVEPKSRALERLDAARSWLNIAEEIISNTGSNGSEINQWVGSIEDLRASIAHGAETEDDSRD